LIFPLFAYSLGFGSTVHDFAKKGFVFVFSIDLQIKDGAFIGVVGQVGCGKSTLLSAMLGETEKLSGDVKIKVSFTRLGGT